MIRSKRRPTADEPAPTPWATALEYERNGTWPRGGNERSRFWSRPDVPQHLRIEAQPDPRRVLGTDEDRLALAIDIAEWKQTRITWLEGMAHG